jgi:hypothetical protein
MSEYAPDPFTPLSLQALFSLELPEITFTVEEILPTGSACLLSAREKSGKGLLALDLCAAVSLAQPFLDRAVVEGPAIYCAAEENIRDVRFRIGQRVGDRRDAPLYVLPLDGSTQDRLRLDDPIGMQRLRDMVEAIQPVILVLDTLRELHDRKEDVSDEMGPLLRPIRQLAHETNTAVIVNHHQSKGGGFRGSTAIRAAFDLEWDFTRTDKESEDPTALPHGTLRVEGRHGPRSLLHISLGEGLRWRVDGALPITREPAVRDRILAHLVAVNAWRRAAEIAAACQLKLKTVQNVLGEMMQEAPRPTAVEGSGAKNDPRRYRSLAAGFDGFGHEMIPPDRPAYTGMVGGNHFGEPSAAGNDRWTG